jgi:cytochrome c oxidase subunit 2
MAQPPAETTAAPAATTPERTRLASLPAKVYFETGQTNLGPQGQEVVAAVASTVKEAGGAVGAVAITGFTDRTGNPNQNLELAKGRAEAVKDELVAEGLSETEVVMKPPTFVTDSGSDAEARRVEIAVEASPEPQQQP